MSDRGLASILSTMEDQGMGSPGNSNGLQMLFQHVPNNQRGAVASGLASLLATINQSGSATIQGGLESVLAAIGSGDANANGIAEGFANLLASVGHGNGASLSGLDSLLATIGEEGDNVSSAFISQSISNLIS